MPVSMVESSDSTSCRFGRLVMIPTIPGINPSGGSLALRADSTAGRSKVRAWTATDAPVENLRHAVRFATPAQVLDGVPYAVLFQLADESGVMRESRKHALYLMRDVGLVRERHLEAHVRVDDVAGTTEVDNDRYGTDSERLEN